MLVHQLSVAVSAQEHGEVIEPRNDPLQFDAVNQENGYGVFLFPNVVEKNVLYVLGLFSHGSYPLFIFIIGIYGFSLFTELSPPDPSPRLHIFQMQLVTLCSY